MEQLLNTLITIFFTIGPCSSNETAVMGDECDSNGFFKPRICRPGPREGTLICACVFPTNGTRLSEVLVDQRSNDVALSRRPTCISLGELLLL